MTPLAGLAPRTMNVPAITKALLLLACLAPAAGGGGLADKAPSWPQFRGPRGAGVPTDELPLPVEFGPSRGMLWKTPLPAGHSSPCIWGSRIFLTAFDADKKALVTLALDRASGQVLWRVDEPAGQVERVHQLSNPAASTPATDGARLYVYFGSLGLIAYDFDGKELWRKPLSVPRTRFGSAASPIVAGERVILACQGDAASVLAVEAATGQTAWKKDHLLFAPNYSAPLLWRQNESDQVVIQGAGGVFALRLGDGEIEWWVGGLPREAIPSPVLGGEFLYVAASMPGGDPDNPLSIPPYNDLLKEHDADGDGSLSRAEIPADRVIFSRGGPGGVGDITIEHVFGMVDANKDQHVSRFEWTLARALSSQFKDALVAIKPGASGNASNSHVAWRSDRGLPEVPSPLYYRGHVYLVKNGGVISCFEGGSGRLCYRERLGVASHYYASPVAGDGKLYIASQSGTVSVLEAGPAPKLVAANNLEEELMATPAIVEGKLYIRTSGHLVAFGQ